jgi:hypothetical protein
MKKYSAMQIFCTNHARTGYGKDDITVERFLDTTISYNENGLPAKEEHFYPDGTPDIYIVTEYNEKGKAISIVEYDSDDELMQSTEFHYDENNNLIQQDGCFGVESGVYSTRYTYENGLLVKQEVYEDDEFAYLEKALCYNEKGLLIKQIDYDEEGNEKDITVNEYDENDLVIKRVRDEVIAKDRRVYLFEYDEQGNKIKDLIYNYEEVLISKTYYTYNEQNQLLEKEDENLDGYAKVVNTFEGENLIKAEMFDKDANLIAWEEYLYDDDNRVCSFRQYNRDEADNKNIRIFTEFEYIRE